MNNFQIYRRLVIIFIAFRLRDEVRPYEAVFCTFWC